MLFLAAEVLILMIGEILGYLNWHIVTWNDEMMTLGLYVQCHYLDQQGMLQRDHQYWDHKILGSCHYLRYLDTSDRRYGGILLS